MSEPKNSSVEPEAILLRLVAAMERQNEVIAKQAEAIDRLAASNEELVDAMMAAPEEEQNPDMELDMAGKPLRKQ